MHRLIVTGCGTGVGKTVVSAILTAALEADYWKPVECGVSEDSDTSTVRELTGRAPHPPRYTLEAPLSPHHAARLQNLTIEPSTIVPPLTDRPLIIETAGGILVPLTLHCTTLDLFGSWNLSWIIVSRHYVGSINHTLLTIETLKNRRQAILGVIFNGEPNPDSEQAILNLSQLPCLGRLSPEPNITRNTIQRYAALWKDVLKLRGMPFSTQRHRAHRGSLRRSP